MAADIMLFVLLVFLDSGLHVSASATHKVRENSTDNYNNCTLKVRK